VSTAPESVNNARTPATGDEAASHSVDSSSAAVEVADAAAELDEALHAADAPASGGVLRRLYDRFAHLLHELSKFGAVGAVAFVIDLTVFNVLNYQLGVESLVSATISMVLGASAAFVGNRFWTWKDRERSGLRREYILYFVFNTVGLLIALACLAISTYGLGSVWPVFATPLAENISKMIVGGGLGTIFRFWVYRTIVFRRVS
jgi:putative flippase GtrA